MKKYRLGVVGQGGRGRGMFRWFSENFEDIEPVAACDIVPKFWYETKENDMTMAERRPNVAFFEDFDEMMAKADLDILDYNNPTPLVKENAAGHFIWGMSSNCVESVMVNGKLVMENRRFPFDEKEIYAKAAEVAKRLWERTDRLPPEGTSGITR